MRTITSEIDTTVSWHIANSINDIFNPDGSIDTWRLSELMAPMMEEYAGVSGQGRLFLALERAREEARASSPAAMQVREMQTYALAHWDDPIA